MSRILDTKEYLDTVVALLGEGAAQVPVRVSGTSMAPFLHPGDVVYLSRPVRPCRVGDIVLFTRPEGRYVLHRIVKKKNGAFLALGDGQCVPEPVQPERIHAVATSVGIQGRILSAHHPRCLFFRFVWRWLAPLRPVIGRLRGRKLHMP